MALLVAYQRRLLTATSCCLLLGLLLLFRLLQQGQPAAPLLPRPLPPHAQHILPYHDEFEYVLNSAVCGGGGGGGAEEPVRAVVVVHSDPRRPEVRRAIRDSLPTEELAALGVRRVFMVADASTNLTEGETTIPQSAIVEENFQHRDLVQGSFHDSYHNLTYKHIMALDWAVTFCPQARHIIKMDDDIVYNVYELLKVLQFIPDTKYLGGNSFPASHPFRGDSKWRVSAAEWPSDLYPPYVSGWLYIVTQDVAKALVLQSTVIPFFWIDDTYVTGVLAEHLSISIRGLKKLFASSPGCVAHTVMQNFSEDRPSDAQTVYAPNVVVAPTDRDLDALMAFNRLSRYCQRRRCSRRRREPVCENQL